MSVIGSTAAYNINFVVIYKFKVICGPNPKTLLFAGFFYTFGSPVAYPGKLYFCRDIIIIKRKVPVAKSMNFSDPTVTYDSNSDLWFDDFWGNSFNLCSFCKTTRSCYGCNNVLRFSTDVFSWGNIVSNQENHGFV